jgi:hypothetical protein
MGAITLWVYRNSRKPKYFFEYNEFVGLCLADVVVLGWVLLYAFYVGLRINRSNPKLKKRLLEMKQIILELQAGLESNRNGGEDAEKSQKHRRKDIEINMIKVGQKNFEATMKLTRGAFEIYKTCFEETYKSFIKRTGSDVSRREFLYMMKDKISDVVDELNFNRINNEIKLFGFIPLNSVTFKSIIVSFGSLLVTNLRQLLLK